MTHTHITERIIWQGIAIEIRYCRAWLSEDINGYNIAHLEIETLEPKRSPLPMTETGYKSHFCQHADILEYGGAKEYVTAWLESEAKSASWKSYIEESRQADLFEL